MNNKLIKKKTVSGQIKISFAINLFWFYASILNFLKLNIINPINKDCIASYFEIKIKKGWLINFYIYLIKNSDKLIFGLVKKSFHKTFIIGGYAPLILIFKLLILLILRSYGY